MFSVFRVSSSNEIKGLHHNIVVICSQPPFKEGRVQFTFTVPFELYLINDLKGISMFLT